MLKGSRKAEIGTSRELLYFLIPLLVQKNISDGQYVSESPLRTSRIFELNGVNKNKNMWIGQRQKWPCTM